ncbi:hypothetical protein C8J57DRAFT_1219528 [Mycena rebaudengoi]|nr:hypothetical protein C8J57DRAFT_1219528 [Mycena rebaudengoi]
MCRTEVDTNSFPQDSALDIRGDTNLLRVESCSIGRSCGAEEVWISRYVREMRATGGRSTWIILGEEVNDMCGGITQRVSCSDVKSRSVGALICVEGIMERSPVDVRKWFLGEEFGGLWVMLPHLAIRNGEIQSLLGSNPVATQPAAHLTLAASSATPAALACPVQSDTKMENGYQELVVTHGLRRLDIYIVAQGGSWVGSGLTITQLDGNTYCTQSQYTARIPSELEVQRIKIDEDVHYLLIIEKEVKNLPFPMPDAQKNLSSGHGYRDLATGYMVVQLLQQFPQLVGLVAVDGDAYRMHIATTYPASMRQMYAKMIEAPCAKLIGVTPSEFPRERGPTTLLNTANEAKCNKGEYGPVISLKPHMTLRLFSPRSATIPYLENRGAL